MPINENLDYQFSNLKPEQKQAMSAALLGIEETDLNHFAGDNDPNAEKDPREFMLGDFPRIVYHPTLSTEEKLHYKVANDRDELEKLLAQGFQKSVPRFDVIESDESYEASTAIMEQMTAQNAVQEAQAEKLEADAPKPEKKRNRKA